MKGRCLDNEHLPATLPPIEAAPLLEYYNPETRRLDKDHLLETAVDSRGIVLPEIILDDVLSTVDPSYKWPMDFCDVHHFVWEKRHYSVMNNGGDTTPHFYREIPFHKGYIPRVLHNYLHAITEQPEVPPYDVMERRVESYRVAQRLFEAAKSVIRFEKEFRRAEESPDRPNHLRGIFGRDNDIDIEILADIHGKFIDRYSQRLGDVDTVELDTLLDIDALRGSQIDMASKQLGRIAAIRSVNMLPMVATYARAA
jgi:hypothetical protein